LITITGGSLKGRRIFSPKSNNVRPTPQMVRSALFNIIKNKISPISFLDIFAGSGIMGFEAISRFNCDITFIERDRKTCKLIERNAAELNISDRIKIIPLDAIRAIKKISRQNLGFSLVFMDPPYKDTKIRDSVLELLSNCNILNEDAIVMVEHDKHFTSPPDKSGRLLLSSKRNWGETEVSFYG
jgi:16S rRNA (guanine966-N2)-methyltransferase